MIEAGYVREMAKYNAWQNKQLKAILEAMDESELRANRGAFFGSILGTLSHLLWGDTLWMSRFYSKVQAPEQGIPGSDNFVTSLGAWNTARFPLDGHISNWAASVGSIDLRGNLSWHSGALGRDVTKPIAVCAMQLFNHQTHHRGQVHAMLTAAGHTAPVTDIPFRPED